MAGGAPKGNTNSAKGRTWAAAIQRALNRRTSTLQREALDDLAEKLLALCDEGDLAALKELGDRLDGKPAQTIVGGEEDGSHKLVVEIVRFANPAAE